MANIKPFRAWRYNGQLARDIGQLVAPPFDVVSTRQREALYRHPYNSIHLSVPAGATPAQQGARTLRQWQEEGTLIHDPTPCIYVYYQYFRLADSDRLFCRKGFICFIEASFWEEQVILRHEDTLPDSVNDRIALLEATQLNASPTHGLYTDIQHLLEPLMDQSIAMPLYQAEDYQGVKDVLAVIKDPEAIRRFVEVIQPKQIILADGHHRYESSLAYRRKMMQQNQAHTGQEGYNFHMIYLTNTESEDLRILPTHRLYQTETLPPATLLAKTAEYFEVYPVENACDIQEIILGKRWTFGLLLEDQSYKICLKEGVLNNFLAHQPHPVKHLDVTVLHHFFIEQVLEIPHALQKTSAALTYERNFAQCVYQVATRRAQLALIVNGVTVNQVKEICYSGEVMPQKTTYFYPKAICGFVFGAVTHDRL